jgi:hypothetical protein
MQIVSFGMQMMSYGSPLIEGMASGTEGTEASTAEYKPYNVNDPNNSLILAQQNAGNIEVLKGQIDSNSSEFNKWKNKTDQMQQSIDFLQSQVDSLVQQQAEFATDLAGDEPVEVTGV